MTKIAETKGETTLVYIEFYDIAYSPGWNTKIDYPTLDHALHVGCGILIREDEDTYIIAMAKGKDEGQDTVLNPLLIFKSLIKEIIFFTRETLNDKKPNRKISRNSKKKG